MQRAGTCWVDASLVLTASRLPRNPARARAVNSFLSLRMPLQLLQASSVGLLEALVPACHGHGCDLFRLVAQLLAILLVARLCGWGLGFLGQPRVVGEMACGLVLGPTILGRLMPDLQQWLFAPRSLEAIGQLSQVGVLVFLFSMGLHLDRGALRERLRSAFAISALGTATPFLLGIALALTALAGERPGNAAPAAFALFLATALSVTAFPVLARILSDRGLSGTRVGATALASASIGDAAAWMMLAVVSGLATQTVDGSPLRLAARCMLLVAAFAALGLALSRLAIRDGSAPRGPEQADRALASSMILLLAAALASQWAGLHALFGAFLAGVALPRSLLLREQVRERLERFSSLVLLPVFFAITGLSVDLSHAFTAGSIQVTLLVFLAAVSGKMGGTYLAARLGGLERRGAIGLSVLMNTRGLMEFVVLQIGRDLGLLSPPLHAALVLMTLATTAMTGPLLGLLRLPSAPPGLPRGDVLSEGV